MEQARLLGYLSDDNMPSALAIYYRKEIDKAVVKARKIARYFKSINKFPKNETLDKLSLQVIYIQNLNTNRSLKIHKLVDKELVNNFLKGLDIKAQNDNKELKIDNENQVKLSSYMNLSNKNAKQLELDFSGLTR